MEFLELQGLAKRYDDFTAVSDCNLSIAKGEFVCLLGALGLRKTTTLQMVAGLRSPASAESSSTAKTSPTMSRQARPGHCLSEVTALFPHMTVSDNVAFGLEMRSVAPPERRKRVAETLELVHLQPFATRYPRELSSGQRQRVAMARALVIQPPVLLLDEPMGALDAGLREEMQIELRALQHRIGVTTIIVTHDQAEALTLADQVVLMIRARIEQVGKPFEMYEQPNSALLVDLSGQGERIEVVVMPRAWLLDNSCCHWLAERSRVRWTTSCAPGKAATSLMPTRSCRAGSARGYSWATTGCTRYKRSSANCS